MPIVRVAPTIADMAGEKIIAAPHIVKAIDYRLALPGLISGSP